jgi:hypothetical protein
MSRPIRQGTDSGTCKTSLATAREQWPNVEWVVVPKLSPDDAIAKAQAMFSSLWIDETRCVFWLGAIGQYHYDRRMSEDSYLEGVRKTGVFCACRSVLYKDQQENQS